MMGFRRGKSERDLLEFVGNVFLLRFLVCWYFVCHAVVLFFSIRNGQTWGVRKLNGVGPRYSVPGTVRKGLQREGMKKKKKCRPHTDVRYSNEQSGAPQVPACSLASQTRPAQRRRPPRTSPSRNAERLHRTKQREQHQHVLLALSTVNVKKNKTTVEKMRNRHLMHNSFLFPDLTSVKEKTVSWYRIETQRWSAAGKMHCFHPSLGHGTQRTRT